jgi:sugar lactone lactonase YvrE
VAVSADTLSARISDCGNCRISVWTRPDASSTTWSSQATFGSLGSDAAQFDNPSAVALSGDGLTAWIADSYNSRVSIWTRPDASSTAWSNQATFGSLGEGTNQLNEPNSLALFDDEQTIAVMDTSNWRVSIWGAGCPA